jgi:hypothetical protein
MLGGVRTVASRFAAGLLRRGRGGAAGCNGISTSAVAASALKAAERGGSSSRRGGLDHAAKPLGLEDMTARFRSSNIRATLLTAEGQALMDAITAAAGADDKELQAPRWSRRDPRWSSRKESITVGELLAQLRWNKRMSNEQKLVELYGYGGGGGGGGGGGEGRVVASLPGVARLVTWTTPAVINRCFDRTPCEGWQIGCVDHTGRHQLVFCWYFGCHSRCRFG